MNHHLALSLFLSLGLLVACGQSPKTSPIPATTQPAIALDSSTPTATEGIQIGITVIPPATWSPTPTAPTKTPEPTWTPVPTKTSSPTSLPTFTPFPSYTTKKILLDYYTTGFHSIYDNILDNTYSDLVLYSDGQLIIPGITYKQKVLSENEKEQFLSKLEELGFYRINSNQKHDPTDHLYNFRGQYGRIDDDIQSCVFVEGNKPRSLCVNYHFREFLIPEMKNILKFLDEYPTEGMTEYYPDRLLLSVEMGRNSNDSHIPKKAVDWPKNLPSLMTGNFKIMFADGKTAKEIYALFGNSISGKVFKENDIEFTVYPKIVLPHEEMKNEGP